MKHGDGAAMGRVIPIPMLPLPARARTGLLPRLLMPAPNLQSTAMICVMPLVAVPSRAGARLPPNARTRANRDVIPTGPLPSQAMTEASSRLMSM